VKEFLRRASVVASQLTPAPHSGHRDGLRIAKSRTSAVMMNGNMIFGS
jgi:hypothetical protein